MLRVPALLVPTGRLSFGIEDALLSFKPEHPGAARHGETRGACRVLVTTAHGRDGPREARIRPCRAPGAHGLGSCWKLARRF